MNKRVGALALTSILSLTGCRGEEVFFNQGKLYAKGENGVAESVRYTPSGRADKLENRPLGTFRCEFQVPIPNSESELGLRVSLRQKNVWGYISVNGVLFEDNKCPYDEKIIEQEYFKDSPYHISNGDITFGEIFDLCSNAALAAGFKIPSYNFQKDPECISKKSSLE